MTLPRRGPVLDHHYGEHRDERNKLFGVQRLVAAPPRPPSVLWAPGPVLLNQGETGHCGGFGAANEAQASPVRVRRITNEWAHGFYYDIKDRHLDPFGREDGTTTQAVMDLYRLRGMARSYAWAFNLTDFRAGLTLGPLLVGTAYLARMFEPNRDGFAEVAGADEGGHLWLCTGRTNNYRGPSGRTYGPCVRMQQSWGEFGLRGRVYLRETDAVEGLFFGRDGEVSIPTDRTFPA
jgi:hypothetical protein